MYIRSSSSYDLDQDCQVAIFYTVVTPMLNPLIYSLRNQEVKGAMGRIFGKLCILQDLQLGSQANREWRPSPETKELRSDLKMPQNDTNHIPME
jgi:hypothetical protein